LLTNR